MSHPPPALSAVRRLTADRPHLETALLNLLVALACGAVAALALQADPSARRLALWPPAGVAVAAAWYFGMRVVPGIYAAALGVASAYYPLPLAGLSALGAVANCLIVVSLLKRLGFDDRLERWSDPIVLALVAAPAGGAAAALVGLGGVALAGVRPSAFGIELLLWFLRDWIGTVVVGALVFTWRSPKRMAWTRPRAVELAAFVVLFCLAALVMFGLRGPLAERGLPGGFLFFPFAGWAGLRFGPRGASAIVLAVGAISEVVMGREMGALVATPGYFNQILIFVFLLLGSLSGQLLAAIVGERDEALARRLVLEEQLRHSQKMEAVGRLAGGIAHDFNNLLTAIIGYTEIVLTSLDPKDERRADAEEIGRAAMRAADLTRQMLAFSRRQVLRPKILDLNTAMQKVEPMLRRVIGEDITMTITPKATRATANVDPGQVEQVIMNLVVNARDAMPQGGRLTVETADATLDASPASDVPDARPGSYVVLSVADTGTGMPPEVRTRIFEPYFTTKDVGKGTGLGLSTVYGIVRQSDGYIGVSSELGLGTTFRVYLPRAEADEPAAVESAGGERLPEGTEHILLVEDDSSVRRLSKELLVRLGYSVTEAASGRAGLALGSDDTRHFDMALCDVILGDMSGPAVAEALQALRPSIKVLYMSGYTDEAIVRTGVLDEDKPFLQKPFTPMQLATKIRELLDEASTGAP